MSLAWCAFNIWPSLLMMHYAAFGYAGLRFSCRLAKLTMTLAGIGAAQILQLSVPAAASAPTKLSHRS